MENQGIDLLMKLLEKENDFLLNFLELIEKTVRNMDNGSKRKLAEDMLTLRKDFKAYFDRGGHTSGFIVNEKDKAVIEEACKKAEKLDEKDNFSFNHVFLPNINNDGEYTLIFKDCDYDKVNKMCEYLVKNEIEFSFDYKKMDLQEGIMNNFKDQQISEIEIDIKREDLIDIVKRNFSKEGIEFCIEEKENAKGIITRTNDEKQVKQAISMLPIDMDDKTEIYQSYKRINDRTEAKEATKVMTSAKKKEKKQESNER